MSLNFKTGLYIKDIWKMDWDTDQVYKFGKMVQNISVSGNLTKQTAKVRFSMQMVTSMKEIGKTIEQMVGDSIEVLMEQHMKVIGKMTYRKEKVKKPGLMEVALTGSIQEVWKMGLGNIVGVMEVITKVNGLKIL